MRCSFAKVLGIDPVLFHFCWGGHEERVAKSLPPLFEHLQPMEQVRICWRMGYLQCTFGRAVELSRTDGCSRVDAVDIRVAKRMGEEADDDSRQDIYLFQTHLISTDNSISLSASSRITRTSAGGRCPSPLTGADPEPGPRQNGIPVCHVAHSDK